MNRRILLTSALMGAIAVALGAFGAHGLKKMLDTAQIEIWAKGVEYQFYHTFALLFLSSLKTVQYKLKNLAFWFFTLGILFFSGSLYLLATSSLLGLSSVKLIGPITPIGGLLFIMGWISIFIMAARNK